MAVLREVALVVVLMAALTVPAMAQTTREHVLGGRGIAPSGLSRTVTSTEGGADARAVVQRVVGLIGLPHTNFEVRASEGVPNAEATTEGKERLILYNPTWMTALRSSIATDWSNWVILAHEVGHHVAFHMDPSFPNHAAELQADYFAGFILQKLGAPLAEVQLAMAMVSTDAATPTHPARAERVAEVRKGWEAASKNVGVNILPAPVPVVERASIAARPAPPENRVALLIGNANYVTAGKLANPKNDVIAVGRELRRLGFSTTVIYDGTAGQIADGIRAFRDEAKDADWAVVYYSGQGIEVDGTNYMIPIDFERLDDFTNKYPQMRLDTAADAVRSAKRVRLVITDACRDDPTQPRHVGLSATQPAKFKVVEPPRGVVVAYSTSAGQTASDGPGDLSPYATALVKALRVPGIELSMVFRRVSAEIDAATRGGQVPVVLGNWPAEDLLLSKK